MEIIPSEAHRLIAVDEKGGNDQDVKRQKGLIPKGFRKSATTRAGSSPLHLSFVPFVDSAGGCVLKAVILKGARWHSDFETCSRA